MDITMDSKDLINETFEIRRKFRDLHMPRELIKKYHETYAEKLENLFNMITSTLCNDEILNKMLKLKAGVDQEKFSQHEASVGVGEILVDTFVKPAMEKDKKSEKHKSEKHKSEKEHL
jgi:hypothetical protein